MVYKGCDDEYAKQVTSEHKVYVKGAKGARKLRWVPKHSHAANHYLDCEVYALAAAEILGVRRLHLLNDKEERKKEEDPQQYAPEEGWIRENEDWL